MERKAKMGPLSEDFDKALTEYFPFLSNFYVRKSSQKLTDDQLKQELVKSLQCIDVCANTW